MIFFQINQFSSILKAFCVIQACQYILITSASNTDQDEENNDQAKNSWKIRNYSIRSNDYRVLQETLFKTNSMKESKTMSVRKDIDSKYSNLDEAVENAGNENNYDNRKIYDVTE